MKIEKLTTVFVLTVFPWWISEKALIIAVSIADFVGLSSLLIKLL